MDEDDDCNLEYALIIIKPDAMICREEILRILIREGFHILVRKKFHLSPEQAAEFLKDWEELKVFMIMVYNLSNGPLELMIVAREYCYKCLIQLLGPWKPIQDRFYCPPKETTEIDSNNLQNVIYGSRTYREAVRDIHFFFPNFIIDECSNDEDHGDRRETENFCCNPNFMKILMEALKKISVDKSTDPILDLSNWLLENCPGRPVISNELHDFTTKEDKITNTDLPKINKKSLDRKISKNTSSLISSLSDDKVIISESTDDIYATSSFSKSHDEQVLSSTSTTSDSCSTSTFIS